MVINGGLFPEAPMNKSFLVILIQLVCLNSFAQVFLEREVISSTGSMGSGSYLIEYTVGQPEYTTGQSNQYILTQGFHQPSLKDEIVVELDIQNPNCSNENLASIDLIEIAGCATENYEMTLNGISSEFPIIDLEEGDYLISIDAGFNCFFESLIEVRVDDAFCDLTIYNLLTPDNDGFNDAWIIENIQLYNNGQNELEIVNRWGVPVFKAVNYNNADVLWTGQNQDGNALDTGTYFYRLLIGDQEFKGFVELLK